MNNVLHILNGDATWQGFNQTGIAGDVMIWREIFSEGPLTDKLDASFWRTRQQWMQQAFGIPEADYKEKVLQEMEKLNRPYNEINIWFEFDLHCQMNMLGVMHLLRQQSDLNERALFLICPAGVEGVTDFRGMGQLNAEQLEHLFDNRIQLTPYDFTLAAEAWNAYLSNDAGVLEQWLHRVSFWGSLHLLKPAMQAHLRRLITNAQGLNYIEETLVDLWNRGHHTITQLYNEFSRGNSIYGMGDREVERYISKLQQKGLITLE